MRLWILKKPTLWHVGYYILVIVGSTLPAATLDSPDSPKVKDRREIVNSVKSCIVLKLKGSSPDEELQLTTKVIALCGSLGTESMPEEFSYPTGSSVETLLRTPLTIDYDDVGYAGMVIKMRYFDLLLSAHPPQPIVVSKDDVAKVNANIARLVSAMKNTADDVADTVPKDRVLAYVERSQRALKIAQSDMRSPILKVPVAEQVMDQLVDEMQKRVPLCKIHFNEQVAAANFPELERVDPAQAADVRALEEDDFFDQLFRRSIASFYDHTSVKRRNPDDVVPGYMALAKSIQEFRSKSVSSPKP